jgi:hypothetical protein
VRKLHSLSRQLRSFCRLSSPLSCRHNYPERNSRVVKMHPNALTLSCAAAISADETWRVIALIRGKGKQPRAQSLTWMHGWAMLHKHASLYFALNLWVSLQRDIRYATGTAPMRSGTVGFPKFSCLH